MDILLKPTELSAAVAISVPYASQIIGGSRTPSRAVAIRIYRATGVKFSPLADLSEPEIDLLERIETA